MFCIPALERATQRALRQIAAQELTLRLFVNDHIPSNRDTLEDYQEADGYGYHPIDIDPDGWELTETDASYTFSHERHEWEFDGRLGSIFGYYVTDEAGDLVFAERFQLDDDEPAYFVRNVGDRLIVRPSFGYGG